MDELPSFEQTQPAEAQSAPLPTFDETQPAGDLPSFENTAPTDTDKYETPGQQALTVAEGAAQGLAGPLATMTEKGLSKLGVPGLSDEEIAGRARANPGEHGVAEAGALVGSMLYGVGEAGLIAKGLESVPRGAGFFARVGSSAFKGAVQMGLIQGGDEISKSLIHDKDPNDSVGTAMGHVAAAALLGAATGGIFSVVGQGAESGLKAIENSKVGNKLTSFLAGFGHSAQSPVSIVGEPAAKEALSNLPEMQDVDWSAFKSGQKAFKTMTDTTIKNVSHEVGEQVGWHVGGFPGYVLGKHLGDFVGKLLGKGLPSASKKYIGPTLVRILSSGTTQNIAEVLNYASAISDGASAITKGVEGVFKAAGPAVINYASETDREKLRSFIEEDGLGQQIREMGPDTGSQFAKGGDVGAPSNDSGLAKALPAHNILLNTAKARISGYLNSVRPTQAPTRPYDPPLKNPEKERTYNRVLDLANHPLSILNEIKDGSLLPHHMAAFTQMYPELYSVLSKRLTARIAKGNLNEETPPKYHVRQSLSLFLGSSLDSSLTPESIQAAQSVFLKQRTQNQPQAKEGSLSKIGAASMTPEQSRTKSLNKN